MRLIFLSGPAIDSRYEIDRDITIGRDVSNDIAIDDPVVSLVHCQIYLSANRAFIKDLGSTNGTIVNGERTINKELNDGDSLVLGNTKIRIEISPLETAPTAPTITTPPQANTILSETEEIEEPTEAQAVNTDLSGNIFGTITYYLKRKIASGGMGSIYEAEQLGAEGFIKKVAIKTILPVYAQKESFVSSFIGEAKLVANLVHQNIVQIHHLGRHKDGYYIAMEYIDGINLSEFINYHKKLRVHAPIDIATFIASRICRGLEYAHNKLDEAGNPLNLVHRDVSPNNIMITKEGEVKLTDFGVAKAAQFMEEDDEYLVGSVEYMSPEQADCGKVDHRSDLFSLGLVYYELLTGVRVFACKHNDIEKALELLKKAHIPDAKHYRSDIHDEINAILKKCLEKDPEKRYKDAGELSYDLEHSMYSKGYGPTIVKLAGYIDQIKTRYNQQEL